MARVGGRKYAVAVPVGLVCAAIVIALVWFAVPAFGAIGTWIGGGAPNMQPADADTRSDDLGADDPEGRAVECRSLYPDEVWSQLAYRPDAWLDQDDSTMRTEATAAVQVAQPDVEISCNWTVRGESDISTTVARIQPDTVNVIDASLRGQGFSCSHTEQRTHCSRTVGDHTEDHTLTADHWIVHAVTGWYPDGYPAEVTARILEDIV